MFSRIEKLKKKLIGANNNNGGDSGLSGGDSSGAKNSKHHESSISNNSSSASNEMGEGMSKSSLNESDLEILHKVSKKPKEEIKFWFEHFLSECPSGKLDREQFVKYYSSFRKNEKADDIAKHAFNAFDAGAILGVFICLKYFSRF